VNLGGQLVTKNDVKYLRSDIGQGKLATWEDIHARYDELWEKYTLQKQQHAYAVLLEEIETGTISKEQWQKALDKFIDIQNYICDQVYLSRKKDYENPFRQATFRHEAEMLASIGTIDDNDFVSQVKSETENLKVLVNNLKQRAL
jgi:hypothetical protein